VPIWAGIVGPWEYAPWQVASDLSISLADALFATFKPKPVPHTEGKCQLHGERKDRLQLQGEKLEAQPPPQFACALKKPPLTRTKASAIPIISVFLIFISLKS
jgi:hypothetical protein